MLLEKINQIHIGRLLPLFSTLTFRVRGVKIHYREILPGELATVAPWLPASGRFSSFVESATKTESRS